MDSLLTKLNQKYQNAEELASLLSKFQLYPLILQAITIIERKIAVNALADVPKLVGVIFYDINTAFLKIEDRSNKKRIEYLLTDLLEAYLECIFKHNNSLAVIQDIAEHIRIVCEYLGYDFQKLSISIYFEKYTVLSPSVSSGKCLYYEWLGETEALDDIAKDLYDQKYIYSVKEFKRMFKPIKGDLKVRFNREKLDEVIILFQSLKELALIKSRGKNNSGHFAPFIAYAVDNENLVFIKNAINKEHERIKKNSELYIKRKNNIKKAILGNIPQKTMNRQR